MVITWPQALAWRMGRHLLDPVAGRSVESVAHRLCGVQAQVGSSADFCVRVRQSKSKSGEVAQALADGRLIKTWAMRATLHLLTPQDAGRYLSLMASTKWWESARWVAYFKVTPAQMEELRRVVRDTLGDQALTREELIAEITAHKPFAHMGDALRSGWGTVFKPLAWQGDICFGPSRGNRVTFMQPSVASKEWAGVPRVEESWRSVVLAYLGAYGPATPRNLAAWLWRGGLPMKLIKGWFTELGDELTAVNVEGEPMYIRTKDAEDLAGAKPSKALRLLGGFDQWVLGPGTDDGHVTPKARRSAVSRTAGWISPVVVVGGVVSGTWQVDGDRAAVTWFIEAGRTPAKALQAEVKRIGRIVGRDLTLAVTRG